MKATIDRSGCISCGLCAEICPEVFYIADDGIADVIEEAKTKIDAAVEDTASEARDNCPVSVISIED